METPSISMTPSGSAILNKACTKEDLPAPVRPIIPIYSVKICSRVDKILMCILLIYHIHYNFRGVKLSQIANFCCFRVFIFAVCDIIA